MKMQIVPRPSLGVDGDHVFTVANSRYVAPPVGKSATESPMKSPLPLLSGCEYDLATVFTLPAVDGFLVTKDYMREQVSMYSELDDVFHSSFLSVVIFQVPETSSARTTTEAKEYLQSIGVERIISTSIPFLPGPYAVVQGLLRDVWKLVDDSQGTCMVTLKPLPK
jgi:hypothetical protein